MPVAAGAVAEGHKNAMPRSRRIDEEALSRSDRCVSQLNNGRYGYRRNYGAVCNVLAGRWARIGLQRIWRREGLKVPQETAAPREVVAKRWFVRAAATGASEPRVEFTTS